LHPGTPRITPSGNPQAACPAFRAGTDAPALTASGTREQKRDEAHEGYHTRERVFGQFGRSFTLPYAVRAEDIRAEFAQGELHVHVPRPAEAQPQRIEIAATD
jgi:HSP20 family molecular chaperone IbpA